jgi:2,5-diketo-D-gluconate reductase A
MALEQPRVKLNDGNTIPQLGLGVWQVPIDVTAQVVGEGIKAGYRSIDTAEGYHNEEGVGEAVRRAEVPRSELFITSKLRNGGHARDKALSAFDETMGKLGLDQLDLFLIHWPVPAQNLYAEAWQSLVELQKDGRIKSIGVSNFLPEHIERIVEETGVKPAVNQIEVHPEYQQLAMREFHKRHDIAIESYSPLGRGASLDNPTVRDIARRHGKSPAQAIIRWHLQQGLIVIPKSANPERIRQNIEVFDFELDSEDMRRIGSLDRRDGKHGSNPATNNSVW